jgi:hypothetical protein
VGKENRDPSASKLKGGVLQPWLSGEAWITTNKGTSPNKLPWHLSCCTPLESQYLWPKPPTPYAHSKPLLSPGFGMPEKSTEMDREGNRDKLGQVKKARLAEWKIKLISLQIGH